MAMAPLHSPSIPVPFPPAGDDAGAPARAERSGATSPLEGPTFTRGAVLAPAPGSGAFLPPVAASWLVSAAAGKAPGAGYAPAATVAGRATTGDWGFLTDPSLSVEEKLSRFMAAVQKRLDDELTDKMNDYRAKYGEAASASGSDGGGFLGGILSAVFPKGGVLDKVFAGLQSLLGDALKTLGGPLLAALATAVGLPALAPAALKVGGALGSAVATATKPKKAAGSTTAKSSTPATSTPKASTPARTSATTKKGESGSPDERLEMLEIQRLVEKQNQLFTLVSNLMKGMHDTGMVAVQNLR